MVGGYVSIQVIKVKENLGTQNFAQRGAKCMNGYIALYFVRSSLKSVLGCTYAFAAEFYE